MLSRVFSKLDNHTLEAVQKSGPSLLVKILGMIATLVGSVLMGRTLGVEGYGILELANRIGSFVLVFCTFGLQYVVLKEMAIGIAEKHWQLVLNTMYTSLKFTGLLSVAVCVLIILLSPYLSSVFFDMKALTLPLQLVMAGVFFQTISRSYMSGINAYGKIWQSNLGDQTLGMIIVLIVYLGLIGINALSVTTAAIAFLTARIVVALVFGAYWNRLKPKTNFIKKLRTELLKPATRLLLASGSGIVSASAATIILGIMSTATEVGLYNLASRIALLSMIVLQIVISVLSPKVAALYAKNEIKQLKQLIYNFTLLLAIVAIILVVGYTLFGLPVIRLWGEGFSQSYIYLLILMFGQFFATIGGTTGTILVMTNNERITGKIAISFMLITILLNFLLILKYGGIGACIATALCTAGENLTRYFIIRKYLGINILSKK
ncbi:oligosaccharide flippase family protein [Leeuwenhoekiella sp. UBA6783]|uniref:oligosaccharide flippase family protein n=1 Tax=Leeuwenhoekiella sp. UBA6783 TaxID=1946747 RepID=UPI0025C3EEE2|nr:oligosaccharide flippase family protein [Leeuwenhoekiella sp. UBA6783]|tara:strand:+ start:1850 stop:3154 length:1305 start_codon:yes stop_codon:yes gene_type:complete